MSDSIFDAAIVGAGPAGCQAARELSRQGVSVLLVEQYKDFAKNNFSSAGVPYSFFSDFSVPLEVAGNFWNRIEVIATAVTASWETPERAGAVLDFSRLRNFLSGEAAANGARIVFGKKCTACTPVAGGYRLTLSGRTPDDDYAPTARIVLDATGPRRAILSPDPRMRSCVQGVGLEYLVEIDAPKHLKNTLLFFLGRRWVPSGYGWIFPMEAPMFKVGVGALHWSGLEEDRRRTQLSPLLQRIFDDYLGCAPTRIIEKHGGALAYAYPEREPCFRGNILGIGDVVSTVNPLGGEGIRHAMHSANLAAVAVTASLAGDTKAFARYERKLRRYLGLRWKLSEIFSRSVYGHASDEQIDRAIGLLSPWDFDSVVDLLFNYRFHRLLIPRPGNLKRLARVARLAYANAPAGLIHRR